jgi:hypothetical protein
VVAGVISTACTYYLPGLFSQASTPAPPITLSVLDNTSPPFRMIVPQARTVGTSPVGECDNFRTWAIARGGEDAGTTSLDLVVQGNTDEPVYIYGIRADVLSRTSPAKGAVVFCPTAGYVTQRPVAIDLDTSGDGRYITKASDSPFGFTVSESDLEVFSIAATTAKCDCKWVLQVEAVVNGKPEQFTVTDHGQPFQTSAYNQTAVEYEWNYTNAWDVMLGERQISQLPAGRPLTGRLPGAHLPLIGRRGRVGWQDSRATYDLVCIAIGSWHRSWRDRPHRSRYRVKIFLPPCYRSGDVGLRPMCPASVTGRIAARLDATPPVTALARALESFLLTRQGVSTAVTFTGGTPT